MECPLRLCLVNVLLPLCILPLPVLLIDSDLHLLLLLSDCHLLLSRLLLNKLVCGGRGRDTGGGRLVNHPLVGSLLPLCIELAT
jgi:hypothetical protein